MLADVPEGVRAPERAGFASGYDSELTLSHTARPSIVWVCRSN